MLWALLPCEEGGLAPPVGCGHCPGSERDSSALSTWGIGECLQQHTGKKIDLLRDLNTQVH